MADLDAGATGAMTGGGYPDGLQIAAARFARQVEGNGFRGKMVAIAVLGSMPRNIRAGQHHSKCAMRNGADRQRR